MSSLIPHSIIPRRMLDLNSWQHPFPLRTGQLGHAQPSWNQLMMGPTSLDLFDPFDELDNLMSQNIDWLHKPDFLPVQPRVAQKYRVTVDCPGFEPQRNAIKTEIKDNKLIVTGHEEDKHEGGDYSIRDFKKTYDLPKNAETDKMISFMPMSGTLVVEVPLKEQKEHLNVDLFPKIVSKDDGSKAMSLCFGVSENIDPSKVRVSIKDRDLIVTADDTKKSDDTTSKMHFYKRTTLPANTDVEKLQCNLDQNKLTCSAPLRSDVSPAIRNVPVERIKQ